MNGKKKSSNERKAEPLTKNLDPGDQNPLHHSEKCKFIVIIFIFIILRILFIFQSFKKNFLSYNYFSFARQIILCIVLPMSLITQLKVGVYIYQAEYAFTQPLSHWQDVTQGKI